MGPQKVQHMMAMTSGEGTLIPGVILVASPAPLPAGVDWLSQN